MTGVGALGVLEARTWLDFVAAANLVIEHEIAES